tara:strand:+ start:1132 stop:1953 length:822 start_codon:yes stop_codon:yes gene_type:complete
MNKRIIPRLEIKGNNLVKGINLEGLRVLGDPILFAKDYFIQGADEIFFQDVVASLYNRNSLKPLIKNVAKEIFVPLTVGGGIRSIDDISSVLLSGADKVSINTAFFNNIKFLNTATKEFGSSTISVAIEVLKYENQYYCYTDNGRNYTNINILDWIKKVQDNGAGEISITSIEYEGKKKGFDYECIDKIINYVDIPLLLHGGADSLESIRDVFNKFNISGVIISSLLHYNFFKNDKKANTKLNQIIFDSQLDFFTTKINDIKKYLKINKINVR